jgi:hypothetical protein
MDTIVFRHYGRFSQYLDQRQRETLIKDYIRARDNYRKMVAEAPRDYEELVRLSLSSGDGRPER